MLGALFNALNIRLTRWRSAFFKGKSKAMRVVEAVLVAFVGCSLFFVLPMFCRTKIMLLFASQFVARFLSRSPITIADNGRCIEMESQMRSPDELDAVNNVLEQDSLASYRGYMCEEGKYNPMAMLSFQRHFVRSSPSAS